MSSLPPLSLTGNHYGTPKPSKESTASPLFRPPPNNSAGGTVSQEEPAKLSGAHPSSEGKRRRNRSNVEAMAAKFNSGAVGGANEDSEDAGNASGENSSSSSSSSSSTTSTGGSGRSDSANVGGRKKKGSSNSNAPMQEGGKDGELFWVTLY